MKSLAFLPLIAVIGCSEIASPTQFPAQRTVKGGQANASLLLNEKNDVVSFSVIACNGEPLLLDGTLHLKFMLLFPSHGTNLITSFSTDYQLRGVGSVTGAKYEAHEKISEHDVTTENATVISSDVTLKVVGQGKVPNSVLGLRVHTVIANDAVRGSHTDVTSRCEA